MNDQEFSDTAFEELQDMAEQAFGPNYDQDKLRKIHCLREKFDVNNTALYIKLTKKEMTFDEFMNAFNACLLESFKGVEEVLGPEDFVKLFGSIPEDTNVGIDWELAKEMYENGELKPIEEIESQNCTDLGDKIES